MARPLLMCAAALLAAALPASAAQLLPERGEAPEIVRLAAPAKASMPTVEASGLLRVGDVRALSKSQALPAWQPAVGGFVTRFRVTSTGALGLRVRLDLGAVPGEMMLRAWGEDPALVEEMDVDPVIGPESWTPWTAGATQTLEIFSRVRPSEGAVRVGAVAHMNDTPVTKAAGLCTRSTACSTGTASLDALITERKKSVAKLQFMRDGGGFVCSATLIDTPQRPTPYLLTANHCIESQAAAATLTTLWFYEATSCNNNTPGASQVQVAGGSAVVFTNYNVDATLLRLNRNPPSGALYSPVSADLMLPGTSIVSISHPRGDTSRWGTGTGGDLMRDAERPYDMYSVNFDRGIIEPGSSGSGLFTNQNGHLVLRGILSQGADELSCTHPTLFTLWGRMEAFHPQIARYIGVLPSIVDDAPNRPQDVNTAISPQPLNMVGQPVVLADRRIDYAGDIDIYKFTLSAPTVVTAFTTGTQDLVSTFLDSGFHAVEANDDAQAVDTNTGMTRRLQAGTHYFSVAHWTPANTGTYGVTFRTDEVEDNYTSLWWNAAESGWGLNVNHQGNILFATLFSYDDSGAPLWLVMSNGGKQVDGSYGGPLYRTTGPAFNAVPWTGITPLEVGTMWLSFLDSEHGTLTYTFQGRTVTKEITRQQFRAMPTCTWSAFDRSYAFNVQDLWWNPAESGWGVNLTHQEDTLFATLFTYAPNGQPVWYVMSEGERAATGFTFSGALYRTRGPAFDANPWTAITATPVGTMSFTFTNGNTGTMTYGVDGVTVTKQIQRQVFSAPATKCES